jgi:hypothetical protein
MQQIADWLKQLGMSEYAERFAENGIDLSVLPDLTDQDLKDMGVLLGHRRKLLRDKHAYPRALIAVSTMTARDARSSVPVPRAYSDVSLPSARRSCSCQLHLRIASTGHGVTLREQITKKVCCSGLW